MSSSSRRDGKSSRPSSSDLICAPAALISAAQAAIASASAWIVSASSRRSLGCMSPPLPAMRVTSCVCSRCAAASFCPASTIRRTIGLSSTTAAFASSSVNSRSTTHLSSRLVLGIYVWTRAVIWLGAIFAFYWFEPNRNPRAGRWDSPLIHDLGSFTDIWARWDSVFFVRVAQHGYDKASAAFYPLYPGLVAALGRAFFGHYVLAGIVISLATALAAFALLYRLAAERLGDDGAWRTVLYVAVFPMSLFLQAVYSESLYLLLVVAAFLTAERGRFAWAGVL